MTIFAYYENMFSRFKDSLSEAEKLLSARGTKQEIRAYKKRCSLLIDWLRNFVMETDCLWIYGREWEEKLRLFLKHEQSPLLSLLADAKHYGVDSRYPSNLKVALQKTENGLIECVKEVKGYVDNIEYFKAEYINRYNRCLWATALYYASI